MLVDKLEQSEVYFKGIFSNKILIFFLISNTWHFITWLFSEL
jgi:hypothetical protein